MKLLARFRTVVTGWKIYKRQTTFLAGCSLAMLYLTVLGFGPIVMGYAYLQGLSELYTSICFGLGSVFGVFGTFLFPKIRLKFGLPKSGIIAIGLQWSMLLLCLSSIWLPGSPSILASR